MWPDYQMAKKYCWKFQPDEYCRAHERYRQTDDRRTGDGI